MLAGSSETAWRDKGIRMMSSTQNTRNGDIFSRFLNQFGRAA
jgi:hypothetical protein